MNYFSPLFSAAILLTTVSAFSAATPTTADLDAALNKNNFVTTTVQALKTEISLDKCSKASVSSIGADEVDRPGRLLRKARRFEAVINCENTIDNYGTRITIDGWFSDQMDLEVNQINFDTAG